MRLLFGMIFLGESVCYIGVIVAGYIVLRYV